MTRGIRTAGLPPLRYAERGLFSASHAAAAVIHPLAVSLSIVRTLSLLGAPGDHGDRCWMITGKLISHGHSSTAIAGDGYTAALQVSKGTADSMAGYGQGCG